MHWSDNREHLTGQTVFCDDDRPVDTGLFDAHGVRLYRFPDKHPIGFGK